MNIYLIVSIVLLVLIIILTIIIHLFKNSAFGVIDELFNRMETDMKNGFETEFEFTLKPFDMEGFSAVSKLIRKRCEIIKLKYPNFYILQEMETGKDKVTFTIKSKSKWFNE